MKINWCEGPQFPLLVKGGALGHIDEWIIHTTGVTYPWRETELSFGIRLGDEEWTPLPNLPPGRAYTAGTSGDGSFYVVAGRRRGRPLDDAYRLSLCGSGFRWDRLPRLKFPRGAPAVAETDGYLLAVGGGEWTGGAFLPDAVPMDELLPPNGEAWLPIPPCPGRRRAACCAVGLRGSFYVFGGAYTSEASGVLRTVRLRDAWRFDVEAQSWSRLPPIPLEGLSGAAAVALDDRYVALVGGAVPDPVNPGTCQVRFAPEDERGVRVGWYNEKAFVFDTSTYRYEVIEDPLPWPAHDIRATTVDQNIVAVGGENVDPTTSNTCSKVRIGKVSLLP